LPRWARKAIFEAYLRTNDVENFISRVFISMVLFYCLFSVFLFLSCKEYLGQSSESTNCITKAEWTRLSLLQSVSLLFTSAIAKGSNNFPRIPRHVVRSDQGKERQSASWIPHREENKNSKWSASYEYRDNADCKFSFVRDACQFIVTRFSSLG